MISIQKLHKSFGEKKVLSNVSLDIANAETTCIIGKSGCGKSVLLKNIVGLTQPDQGSVVIDDKNIHDLNQKDLFTLRRNFGFVFQGAALFDSLSVYENVIISLFEHGQRDHDILSQEAKRVLSAVGLLPDPKDVSEQEFSKEWKILSNKIPSDLSGGMRKRVAVARALVGSPKYIFYDEPTTGLDPVTSEQIDDLIKELAQRLNVTSIVITHDMFSVFRIAEFVAMLHNGQIQFTGTPEQLQDSTDPVVTSFIKRFM